ncbi:MAG: 2-C-methyl-D-erythritol 4-phosphate cytidylyltransferase, partial [Acholeplasmatales bacterium]|nr:2-C-methyl-D-erythritol 4-phosphate cytidylyltransferase [Acholeplasmatales bacterium]
MSLNFACIVLAAGDSTRYNINNFSTYNKTLLYINNKRLYEYSTDIFLSLNIKTYLVVRKEDMEIVKKETLGTGITIVGGGKSRTMSVKNAL